MYKWFALRRILRGIIMYVLLIFLFSLLFNQINETVTRSQIGEQIKMEVQGLRNLNPDEMIAWKKLRENELIRIYHLDRPFLERVSFNAISILSFKYGKSMILKSSKGSQKVFDILLEAIPRTMILFTTSLIIQIFLALRLGVQKAKKPGGKLDKSTSFITMVVYGMPSWWLAMLLILLFVYIFKFFPSGGLNSAPPPTGFLFVLDRLWHMALPILTLVLIGFWGISYMIRNLILGTLQEDFIMSARARGIPEKKVLYGHTLRTSAPPLVTMALLSLLASMSGAIIFEGIFSWPGLGNLYWIAVQQNDIPVLMGNLAVTTGIYLMGLVLLDLIYGFLDPRIKVGGKA